MQLPVLFGNNFNFQVPSAELERLSDNDKKAYANNKMESITFSEMERSLENTFTLQADNSDETLNLGNMLGEEGTKETSAFLMLDGDTLKVKTMQLEHQVEWDAELIPRLLLKAGFNLDWVKEVQKEILALIKPQAQEQSITLAPSLSTTVNINPEFQYFVDGKPSKLPGSSLFMDMIEETNELGYRSSESSYTLFDNHKLSKGLKQLLQNGQFREYKYVTDILYNKLYYQRLDGLTLSNTSLNNLDLNYGTSLKESSFSQLKIADSDLSYVNFDGSELSDVTFENVNLSAINFSHTNFKNVTFKNCDLTQVRFDNSVMDNINFNNCDLSKSHFDKASLDNVNFRSGQLKGAYFGRSHLQNIRFDYCELGNNNFRESTINETEFVSTSGVGVDMSDTQLNQVNFTDTGRWLFENARLDNCTFNHSNLNTNFFKNAVLINSTLKNCLLEKGGRWIGSGFKETSNTIFKQCDLSKGAIHRINETGGRIE